MPGVYKLRIVKGKVTRDQFRAILDLLNKVDQLIGDRVSVITFGKHPERPIYTIKFILDGEEDVDTVRKVLKEIDMAILDMVHSHFEGKRNVITFSYSIQDSASNGDQPKEAEAVQS